MSIKYYKQNFVKYSLKARFLVRVWRSQRIDVFLSLSIPLSKINKNIVVVFLNRNMDQNSCFAKNNKKQCSREIVLGLFFPFQHICGM